MTCHSPGLAKRSRGGNPSFDHEKPHRQAEPRTQCIPRRSLRTSQIASPRGSSPTAAKKTIKMARQNHARGLWRFLRFFGATRGKCGARTRSRSAARHAPLCESRLNVSVVARGHDVVARWDDVVAPKYRFCATSGLGPELCVSRSYVRGSIDFRTTGSDRLAVEKRPNLGDASTGLDWGSGEHWPPGVKSQNFDKLRMCAMRNR